MVRQDSSAIKFDIYFNFIILAEPITDEGREETRIVRENP